MAKIGCSVQNCKYWQNDICTADEIQVNLNERYNNTYMEIGVLAGQNAANTSQETQCSTFIPRG
ncbi:hypothetical protein BBF96_10390 [Anoxybacter fermentans]|uniref:DUF1540 domain-containing protein n=1 Tax=Anoxybacter fermentans TaxID=1323375 RepID=A0A3Q9HR92_9FIRM|nr:DUF1540 domain-containing protein [Anoxybacter fermentans]AZR73756.1 hypothetical protein BBF96_10390 [Anoxybacter fermentans]